MQVAMSRAMHMKISIAGNRIPWIVSGELQRLGEQINPMLLRMPRGELGKIRQNGRERIGYHIPHPARSGDRSSIAIYTESFIRRVARYFSNTIMALGA
jgi:hypothetical protein